MTKIMSKDVPYISGEKFSDGFLFDIVQSKVFDRLEVIDKLIQGKNVLHIGCVDHPLSSDRISSDRWLHGRLSKLASNCLGVDINQEGIDFLREKHQISNIVNVDLTDPNLSAEITATHWDYVVFGEILEHVDNPVDFLASFRKNYGDFCSEIILTVPNAFRFGNISSALRNKEFINSDHRYWFSPFTICKVFHQAGIPVQEVFLCKFTEQTNWKGKIRSFILNRYPLFSEDILVIAKSNNS
jgi:Methyltransferase domain